MITGIKMIAVQMGRKVIFCIFKKTNRVTFKLSYFNHIWENREDWLNVA